jgi:uncharacterized membrane protein YfcA
VHLSLAQLAFLFGVALAAGTVDAIAGGGGLLMLPALLAAGLPPHLALGTNKGSGVFGAAASLWRYSRAGLVDGPRARAGFPLAFAGSLLGAAVALRLSPEVLRPVVLVLLVAVAILLALRPSQLQPRVARPPRHDLILAGLVAFVLGGYDGFFGPGTGTFLIFAFVMLFGLTMARASADAKAVNFASNLAAAALFSLRGAVLWRAAIPMAAGQLCGGFLGAHLAVRGGDRLVRATVLVVVLALVLKLGNGLV